MEKDNEKPEPRPVKPAVLPIMCHCNNSKPFVERQIKGNNLYAVYWCSNCYGYIGTAGYDYLPGE